MPNKLSLISKMSSPPLSLQVAPDAMDVEVEDSGPAVPAGAEENTEGPPDSKVARTEFRR